MTPQFTNDTAKRVALDGFQGRIEVARPPEDQSECVKTAQMSDDLGGGR